MCAPKLTVTAPDVDVQGTSLGMLVRINITICIHRGVYRQYVIYTHTHIYIYIYVCVDVWVITVSWYLALSLYIYIYIYIDGNVKNNEGTQHVG